MGSASAFLQSKKISIAFVCSIFVSIPFKPHCLSWGLHIRAEHCAQVIRSRHAAGARCQQHRGEVPELCPAPLPRAQGSSLFCTRWDFCHLDASKPGKLSPLKNTKSHCSWLHPPHFCLSYWVSFTVDFRAFWSPDYIWTWLWIRIALLVQTHPVCSIW